MKQQLNIDNTESKLTNCVWRKIKDISPHPKIERGKPLLRQTLRRQKKAKEKMLNEGCENMRNERENNYFWRIMMKNKKIIRFTIFIMLVFIIFGNISYAAIVKSSCRYHSGYTATSEYTYANESQHTVTQYCDYNGYTNHGGDKEDHSYTLYSSAGEAGHYKNRCICGATTTATLLAHSYNDPITDSIGTKHVCKDCSYFYYEGSTIAYIPSEETPAYYTINNTSSRPMTVYIDLYAVTNASGSYDSNLLEYTDSIPANTTRTYLYYLTSSEFSSLKRIAVLGYTDGKSSSGKLLMMAAPRADNNYTMIYKDTTFPTYVGNEVEKWTTMSSSDTAVTLKVSDLLSASTNMGSSNRTSTSYPEYFAVSGTTCTEVEHMYKYGAVTLEYTKPDATAPTVEVNDISYGAAANISLTDSESGIRYWAVTNSTSAPSSTGSSNATTGNTLNYWYPIANSTATQTVTFTQLAPGTYYAWGKDADGNQTYKAFNVTKLSNTLSVSGKALTYNGSAQNLVSVSSAQGTVYYSTTTQLTSSNYSSYGSPTIPTATDVGNGNFTIYYYTDGNTYYLPASGSVSSTMGRLGINKPTAKTGLVYNTNSQTGVPTGTGYTITGNTGINAGNYSATATPTANYQWSDGTPTAISIPWTISKASRTISLTSSSLSVLHMNTNTMSFSYTGEDVTASAGAGSTSIASASMSDGNNGGTVTITGNQVGSTVVTITVPESTNYNTTYASFSVTVTASTAILTLDPNGGSVGTTSITLTYGSTNYYELTWNMPTRTGYTFNGWYTAPTGGTKVYGSNGYVVNEGTYWSNNTSLQLNNYTLYAQWLATPEVTISEISTNNVGWEGWNVGGGATITNGELVLPSVNAYASKTFLVDGNKWTVGLTSIATSNASSKMIMVGSSYYDANFNSVYSQNNYPGNGWAPAVPYNVYGYDEWDGYGGYGSNVKYVTITISYDSAYSSSGFRVQSVNFSSELDENYVGARINASVAGGSLTSLKYLWTTAASGVTAAQVTNETTNGSVVYPKYGAKGTYYLWVLATDSNGGQTLQRSNAYTIDNPEIELSVNSETGVSSKVVNTYIFNQANKRDWGISYNNGATATYTTSNYYGSEAWYLEKTGTASQWHGAQPTTTLLGRISAGTYVVVSANYKTTNPGTMTWFEGNGIYYSDWSGPIATTRIASDLGITADGNEHHIFDIITSNVAITSSAAIATSATPNWGYSSSAGNLTLDGSQFFVFTNMDEGIAVKKFAKGSQEIPYFRTAGTAFSGTSFTADESGVYTVYTKTTSGVERVKTINVTGIVDKAGPEVTITNNGTALTSDPTFATGYNGIYVYNNLGNGTVTVTRVQNGSAPNDSGYALHIKTTGSANPDLGGFYFANQTAANEVFITKIVAKIPVGCNINWHSNPTGDGTFVRWLTSTAGTGDWATYICYLRTGSTGSFSSTNFFALSGVSASTSSPVEWDVAYANVYKTSLMNWTNQNVTITGNALDADSSTVAYAFTTSDTTPTSWTTVSATTSTVTGTYSATASGTVFFWAKDSLGNISKTATYIERIDKEAPVITNIYRSPDGWTNESTNLIFSATDNASGVSGYATSPWSYDYCTSFVSISPSIAVNNQQFASYGYNKDAVYLVIKDQAGNTARTYISAQIIDKTAPIITDGKTHTAQEYYDNASKGTMLESSAGFTWAPDSYYGGSTAITSINDGTVNSSQVLKVTHAAGTTTSGYIRVHYHQVSKVYVRKILAKIPVGYSIRTTGNTVGGINQTYITSTAGTGSWKEYAYVVTCGDNTESNMDFGHLFIEGSAASSAFEWYVASDATYDVTNVLDNVNVTYSGANAVMNITSKDTQSGTASITVNDVAQTFTTSGVNATTSYTVSAPGTYKIVATDGVGNSTTLNKSAYTITYNGNGATGGSTATAIKIENVARSISENGYTRPGYKFLGWNTAEAGNGTAYSVGSEYTTNSNLVLYAQWQSAPEVTISEISTNNVGWEGWTLGNGATINSSNELVLTTAGQYAQKWFLVDEKRWTVHIQGMSTVNSNGATPYAESSYFDKDFNIVTSQNGYDTNGWAPDFNYNSWTDDSWTGYDGYGSNVKYVRFTINYNSGPIKIRNLSFTSEMTENYVGARINVSSAAGISSIKYLWTTAASGVTEAQVTNETTNGSVVYPKYGSKGTYYLWTLVTAPDGGKTLQRSEVYTIDNPEIELSVESGTATMKNVNAFVFNQENKKDWGIWTNNGGTITSTTSNYYGSDAYYLVKTGTGDQWHGTQPTTTALGGIPAGTYVVVSSNYKTTNPGSRTWFDGNGIYSSDWQTIYSSSTLAQNLGVIEDGNEHHVFDILKMNVAVPGSTAIAGSAMPSWGYSTTAGNMTIDGSQFFVFTNMDEGIAVKKYAKGNQQIPYFQSAGTEFTGTAFTADENGVYTVYTKTTSGVERVRTVEVTGIVDNAGPEVSITNNGQALTSDPTFINGINGVEIYNNLYNGNVTITRQKDGTAPNDSDNVLHIKTTGQAAPDHGGFYFANQTAANEVYTVKIVAKIPVGYTLNWASNAIGTDAATRWMTSQEGTGDWKTYIFWLRTGSYGDFSSTNFFYLTGGTTASASAPVEWDVAYANVYKTSVLDWTNQNITITGNAVDSLSGTVAYAFTTTDTTPTSWTDVSTTNSTVTGTYEASANGIIFFWAKDANGNVSKTATIVEKMDKDAPIVTMGEQPAWSNVSSTITWSGNDNGGSGIAKYELHHGDFYTYDMGLNTSYSWYAKDYTLGSTAAVYIRAIDVAGNVGEWSEVRNLRLDSEVPSVPTITSKLNNESGAEYTAGSYTNENIWVSVDSTDQMSGIAKYQIKQGSNGTWTDITGNTKVFENNVNDTIYFRAIDNANNIGQEASIEIRKDETLPTVEVKVDNSADGNWTTGDVSINVTGKDETSGVSSIEYSTDNATWTTIDTTSKNLLLNSDFSDTFTANYEWDTTLNGNTVATSWSGGYNPGVDNPSVGYHAHINTTDFEFNTLKFVNKNGQFGYPNRWLGYAQEISVGTMKAGTTYTISYDVYTDTAGTRTAVGIYHNLTNNSSWNFHSGINYETNTENEVGKWVRRTYTFTTHSNFNTSVAPALYIYGEGGQEGINWIKNIQLEESSTATNWAAHTSDQTANVKDGLVKVNSNYNGTYYFRAIDNAGNVSSVVSRTIKTDGSAPEVTIANNGTAITSDPTYKTGTNGIYVYNNLENDTVTINRVQNVEVPNDSGYTLHIKTTGQAEPGLGGFTFANQTAANQVFVTKIVAKIPVGYNIEWHSNHVGDGMNSAWLTSQAGTGDWATYILYLKTGSTGTFQPTNYFALSGAAATASSPVEWDVAYANVYRTSLMDWTKNSVTITGNALDVDSGTVAYAFTTTEAEPTAWTTVSSTTNTVTETYDVSANGKVFFWAKDSLGNVSKTATYIERIEENYSVNGKYYPTLAAAYASIADNTQTTIKVEKSNTDNTPVIIEAGKNVILDLNGKTITVNYLEENAVYESIFIEVYGTFEMIDSVGNGSIERSYSNPYVNLGIVQNAGGKLTITSGTYTINTDHWYPAPVSTDPSAINSTTIINGGTINCNYAGSYGWPIGVSAIAGNVEINGGNINVESTNGTSFGIYSSKDGNASIAVNGGAINSNYVGIGLSNYSDGNNNAVKLKISGTAEINANYIAVYNFNSIENIEILGGTLNGGEYGVYNTTSKTIIGTNDSTVSNEIPEILGGVEGIYSTKDVEFYDGIFKGQTAAMNVTGTITKPDGYGIVNSSESIDSVTYKTAYLGEGNYSVNGNYYETLKDAYTLGVTGTEGTIVVERDNTDSSSFTVEAGKKVILDTNGKTITKTVSGLTNNGTLIIDGNGTIQTETIDTNTITILIPNNGTITVNNGTIINKGIKEDYYRVIYGGNININGGTVKAVAEGTVEPELWARTINIFDGTLNITDGKIISDSAVIESYATSEMTGNINIAGGYIESNGDAAIYLTGLVENKTALVITGGQIKATKGYGILTLDTFKGSIVIGTDDDTVLASTPVIQGEQGIHQDNPQSEINIEFYDGIFKGQTAAMNVTGTVTTPEGYDVVNNTETIDDLTYKTAYLGKGNYSVDGKFYETLERAYTLGITGTEGTIVVERDNTDSSEFTVEEGKNITINTNGRTVIKTASGLTNNGTLTIEGTGAIQTAEADESTIVNLIVNAGELNIEEGSLINKGCTTNYWNVILNNSSTAQINLSGGNLIATKTEGVDTGEYNARAVYSGAGIFNMTGGNIESKDYGIHSHGDEAGQINISGGRIKARINAIAVSHPSDISNGTTLTISGGTVEAEGRTIEFVNTLGTITITGGTIKSTVNQVIYSKGNSSIIIGTDDGTVSTSAPVIQGNYGIVQGDPQSEINIEFYDGIAKGQATAMDVTSTVIVPEGYKIATGTETIDEVTYQTAYLVEKEKNYSVDGVYFETLAEAYASITGTEETIIKVEQDNTDNTPVTIAEDKNIVIDLNGKTITVNNINGTFITNSGTLEMKDSVGNGKIDMSCENSTISLYVVDNKNKLTITSGTYELLANVEFPNVINSTGNVTINGGTINAKRNTEGWIVGIHAKGGTLYMNAGTINSVGSVHSFGITNNGSSEATINVAGGTINASTHGIRIYQDLDGIGPNTSTVNISGTAYIYGSLSGVHLGNYSGNTNILGGTIEGGKGIDLVMGYMTGLNPVLTIGTKDGNVSTSSPEIIGETNAILVYEDATFNFYDGILKGKTLAIEESTKVTATETGYEVVTGEDGDYKTAYLKKTPTLIANPSSVTVQQGSNVEIELTYSGDGEIIVDPIESNIATAPLNGKIITVTGVNVGTIKLSVTLAETDEYAGKTIEIDVNVLMDDARALITEWTIPANADSDGSGTTVRLPVSANGNNNYSVDWGDGTIETYTSEDCPSHEYTNDAETKYIVKVIGKVERFGCTDWTAPTSDSKYYTFTQYLTGLKAWGELGAAGYGFANCINLEGAIPASTENTFVNVNEFSSLFVNCKKITSLPENLFKNASKVYNLNNAFNGCTGLTTLPATLFDGVTNAQGFYGTFQGCTGLTEIPEELFENNKAATSFALTFQGCSELTEIPEDLFVNNVNVTSFESTFNGCTRITSIPGGLFSKNTKVKQFNATFYGCTELTGDIPRELFANTKEVTTFGGMFNACAKLTGGELLIDTSNNPDISTMFARCTGITTLILGEDFKNINGSGMFSGANNLKALILSNNAASESEVGTLGELTTIGLPEDAIIYVPTEAAEGFYEAAWDGIIDDTRVEPILSLVGNDKVTIEAEETYTEEGYNVAGYPTTQSGEYTKYGYTVTTSDSEAIDANGSFVRTYALKRTVDEVESTVMEETRTIEVLSSVIPNYSVDGVYYETLADAYAAIKDGEGTIIVEQDNEDSSVFAVEAGKNITIDTNEKTITKIVSGLTNNGVLTIEGNGVIQTAESTENTMNKLISNTEGVLNINDVTLISKGVNNQYWHVIYHTSSSTAGEININNATIKTTENSLATESYGARTITVSGTSSDVKAIININSSDIINEDDKGVAIETYNFTGSGEINISNGSRIESPGAVINMNNPTVDMLTSLNVNIHDSTLLTSGYQTAIRMLEVCKGNLSIINSNIKSNYKEAIMYNGSGKVIIGTNDGTITKDSSVIQGETYGITSTADIEFYDGVFKGQTAAMNVTGKVITPEGYDVVNNRETIGDKVYKTAYIGHGNYSVDGLLYETLERAYTLGVTGTEQTTIKVEKSNIDNTPVTIAEDKNVVIDLNGKTITVNGITTGAAITNAGTLELKDNVSSGAIKMSTAAATGSIYNVSNTGTLTVTSGTYTTTSNGHCPAVICSRGITNVNGGTITTTNNGITGWSAGIFAESGTLNVTGGTINGKSSTLKDTNVIYSIVNNSFFASKINVTGGTINSDGKGIATEDHVTSAGVTGDSGSSINISGEVIINATNYGIVNNYAVGGITITGGTIKSSSKAAILNRVGTLTIGTNDAGVSTISPVIQGTTYGIESTSNLEFYDGIFKATDTAMNVTGTVTTPEGYDVVNNTETIDDITYKTAYLGTGNYSVEGLYYETLANAYAAITGAEGTIKVEKDNEDSSVFVVEAGKTVTLDTNGKTITKKIISLEVAEGGTLTISGSGNITSTDPIDIIVNNGLLNIEGTGTISQMSPAGTYSSVLGRESFSAIYGLGSLNITGEANIISNAYDAIWQTNANNSTVNISAGTISGRYGICFRGLALNITGGTITGRDTYAVTNRWRGVVSISGGNISCTGPHAVENWSSGTVKITGGSINAEISGIKNDGTLIVGNDDGIISTSSPVIQGSTYGVDSTTSVEFYDGIFKGQTAAMNVSGDIITPDGYVVVKESENIGGVDYETAFLKKDISNAIITINPEINTYTGSEIEPSVSVSLNGNNLAKGTEYSLKFTDNVDVGDATVTITGVGNYTGTISKSFKIVSASMNVTSTGHTGPYDGQLHEITVNVTGITGATITYATTENGTYSTTNPTFADAGTYTVYYKVEKANYGSVTGSETITITRKPIKLEWSDTRLVYNGQEQLPTVKADSGVAGETINLKITAPQINAGRYKAVATIESVTGGRENANNYVIVE